MPSALPGLLGKGRGAPGAGAPPASPPLAHLAQVLQQRPCLLPPALAHHPQQLLDHADAPVVGGQPRAGARAPRLVPSAQQQRRPEVGPFAACTGSRNGAGSLRQAALGLPGAHAAATPRSGPAAGLQLWGNCCAREARGGGGGGPRSARSSLRAPRARSPGARRPPPAAGPASPRPQLVSGSRPCVRARAPRRGARVSILPSLPIPSPPFCFPLLRSRPPSPSVGTGTATPAGRRAAPPKAVARGRGGGQAPGALALGAHQVPQRRPPSRARVRPARGAGRRPPARWRNFGAWGGLSAPESGFSKWAPLSISAKLSKALIKNADLWVWAQTH